MRTIDDFKYSIVSGKLYYRSELAKVTHDSHGHLQVYIYGRLMLVHRVIWRIVTNEWPEHQIDHINLHRDHNQWINLRAATNGQNQQNRFVNKNNKLGIKG